MGLGCLCARHRRNVVRRGRGRNSGLVDKTSSAYQEFVADTDPLDPASRLIMTIERCDSGFELSFKTAPDRVYELHHAESIDELISAPTVESIQGTGSTVTRQFEAGPDTLFFRVTVALPEND